MSTHCMGGWGWGVKWELFTSASMGLTMPQLAITLAMRIFCLLYDLVMGLSYLLLHVIKGHAHRDHRESIYCMSLVAIMLCVRNKGDVQLDSENI